MTTTTVTTTTRMTTTMTTITVMRRTTSTVMTMTTTTTTSTMSSSRRKSFLRKKKLRRFINKNFFLLLPSSRFRLMRCLYKDKLLSVPINAPSKKTRLRDRFRLKNEKDFFLTGRKKRLKSFLTFCFSFQASFLFSFFHLRSAEILIVWRLESVSENKLIMSYAMCYL